MKEILTKYQQRSEEFAKISGSLQQKYNRFSLIRLAVFFITAFLIIYLFANRWFLAGGVCLVAFLVGFSRFMNWHIGIQRKSRHYRHLSDLNQQEAAALQHRFHQFANGQEFLDPLHPFAIDLDIFGKGSLFQYCNRTSTHLGRKTLARYLTRNAATEEVTSRQSAIRELSKQLDWRQHFQATGQAVEDDPVHLQELDSWLKKPSFVNHNRWLKIALWVVPVWMIIGAGLSVWYLSWYPFLLFVLLPGYILNKTKPKVDQTHLQTNKAGQILNDYADLLRQIETYPDGQSEKLLFLKKQLFQNHQTASQQVKQLAYYIRQLNIRDNFFSIFFNIFSLWDLIWVRQLEQWRERNRTELPQWFDVLQEFEALSSFANLHFNQPDWAFPAITDNPQLTATRLGHPLIHESKRVCNDFQTPTQSHLKLITGSNMAGKSTFLRTVGINIILANAGSVVCAELMSLPMLEVYTSMRTQDNLQESTSSFFAELKRLKIIIQAVESGKPIYFLMDEILKGTNSRDRHTGSRALIQQMIDSGGAGIIATHDLELGDMAAQSGGAIENLCIEVAVKNGELIFDYQLKKGVSESFNATILMREMGIDVAI